jgi:Ser/Thr protein kinase RdoA (MazF antagonist)
MNRAEPQPKQTAFHTLTPDMVISLVEKALGVKCTNLCRPLTSYINRVFELASREGDGLVAKFYRPGRWSTAALQDEHDFLLDLLAAEIPVVGPCTLVDGTTLASFGDINFAVFPKKGGRSVDEFTDEEWLQLGRLLGRTHAVGATRTPRDRIVMAPDKLTRAQVDYLLSDEFVPRDLRESLRLIADELISEITPLFAGAEMIRIHGDCHFANFIHRLDESFFLIDFDDMAVGPPVQDLWMLLPGYQEDSRPEIELFLEGYETFRAFDRRTLRLIEPLRAMRYIHFITWCAHQVAEDGSSRLAPDFGSHHYWQREIRDLTEQLQRIRETLSSHEQSGGNR